MPTESELVSKAPKGRRRSATTYAAEGTVSDKVRQPSKPTLPDAGYKVTMFKVFKKREATDSISRG